MSITPVIVVDTREQDPWSFRDLPTEPGSLSSGDYSIKGLEHLISVERKSLPDLLACCGYERARFKRELQRLRAYRFRCLVVETDYSTLERGGWRSKIQPASVLGSLAAWTAQYSIPIWLAGNRESAAGFAERYLFQCARLVAQENKAIGCQQAVA